MATIADVFMRVRIDKSQLKNDAESGLKSVDTKTAGRKAGEDFGNEFSKSSSSTVSKSANRGGQDYAKKFSEGFSVKRALIGTAITAALAAGPAAIAAAGAVVGLGFAAAAGTAIYKSLSAQLKAANKDLATAEKSKNKDAIANAKAQVAALQQQLAAYNGVKNSITDLRTVLISVGNKALVTSGILKTTARVITDLGAWITAHQALFTNLFKAAAPYVQIFVTFLERLIATSLPIFTKLMQQAAPAVNAVLGGILKFVGSGLGPFLTTVGKNAALFAKAFSTILNQLIPLLPLLGGVAVIVAKLVVAFPQLVPVVLALAVGFKALLIISSVAEALTKLKDITIVTTAVTWLMNDACIGTRLGLLALSAQEAITAAASTALAVAMDAIPFIAIAAAIIALTFIIIKYHKQIFNAIVGTWNLIYRDVIVPVINWFTKTIPHAFSVTITWLKQNWPLLIGIIGGPVAEVAGIIFKYHAQILKSFQVAWSFISRFLVGIWNDIKHGIGVAFGAIAAFFSAWWRNEQALFVGVATAIWHALGAVWAAVSRTTVTAYNNIKSFFAGWWHNITAFFTQQLTGIERLISIVWGAVKSITGSVWNAITAFFRVFWSGLVNLSHGNLTNLENVIGGVWNRIKSITGTIWNEIKNAVFGVWNALKGATQATFQSISDTIGRIWGGIVRVVKTPIKAVIQAYNIFADGVNFVANKVFGQHIDARIHTPKGFKSGGKVTSGTGETADDVLVRVSKNETIVSAGHSRVLAPAFAKVGVPGYAKGGVPKTTVDLSQYTNPLPNPRKLIPTRIDQGVDFQGAGPMAALGDAEILNTTGGGWPGGPYMSFRLIDGILSGLAVYYAENIHPLVKPGMHVKKGQHIADWFDGGTGIEMGFDDGSGSRPLSQTKAAGSISGANLPGGGTRPTQVGKLFDELLVATGLPFAPNYNLTPGGSLPGGLAKLGGGGNIGTELEALAKSVGHFAGSLITDLAGIVGNTLIPAPLRHALSVLVGGVGGATKALGKPTGEFLPIVGAALGKVGGWAADWANNKVLDKVASLFGIDLGSSTPGTGPAGQGASGSEIANGQQIYSYLLKNLFGGNKIAAAGATASIWGESTWNPFATGTGGRGLIGWTPPSTISNADFSGGMKTQLPAILRFVTSSGDSGVIADMFRATSVAQAANEWGRGVERFGINDVHSEGLQLATQFMTKNAWGGSINQPVFGIGANGQGYSFGENGPERIVAPGKDPLLTAINKLIEAVNAVPAKTAAGTAKAINAPKGQEATAARFGAR